MSILSNILPDYLESSRVIKHGRVMTPIFNKLKCYILGIHHTVRVHREAGYLSDSDCGFNIYCNLKNNFNNALTNVINQKPYTLFECNMELSR